MLLAWMLSLWILFWTPKMTFLTTLLTSILPLAWVNLSVPSSMVRFSPVLLTRPLLSLRSTNLCSSLPSWTKLAQPYTGVTQIPCRKTRSSRLATSHLAVTVLRSLLRRLSTLLPQRSTARQTRASSCRPLVRTTYGGVPAGPSPGTGSSMGVPRT